MYRLYIVVVVIVALLAVQLLRPVPAAAVSSTTAATYRVPGSLASFPWPTQGQSALAIEGMGIVGHAGSTRPQAIASLAKMMTAYLVLKAHPLAIGQGGPTFTMTAADVALYLQDKNAGDSVVPVAVGEQLNERQMLEALLLPSGDNIAAMLAQWMAGSESAFVAEMNQEAKKLGMDHTYYADASGVSPATVSTAVDQTILAERDMTIRTFRHIVAMAQVTLPVGGVQYNVNYDLGQSGIIGVKTGSTNQAGGCYVAAAYRTIGSQRLLVIATVLGQGGVQILQSALNAGKAMLNASPSILTIATVVQRGRTVARVATAWHGPVTAVAARSVSFLAWPGMTVHWQFTPSALPKTLQPGTQIGTLTVRAGTQSASIPVRLTGSVPQPSLKWRLTRL
jgi:D-alanyl-D-alanine carboxypeptidase (penicillin-binding protein 5/6)